MPKDPSTFSLVFEKQQYHLMTIILFSLSLFLLFSLKDFTKESFLGITTTSFIFIAFGLPIIHQVFVMMVWRLELHLSLVSRILGSWGFPFYGAIFMILFISRFLILLALAIANSNTLILGDYIIHMILIAIFFFLGLYLIYSVARFFGIKRALGIDHFDRSYKQANLVHQGIFQYISNAMYVVGFLLFYIPGLLFSSFAALLMALVHHLYIWVHYYSTEKPDMIRIYGRK